MPAHAPLVRCVQKTARITFAYETYCLVHWNEENEGKDKIFEFNS